jgi:hypothetical protein
MVTQIFTSRNQIAFWLKQIEGLRQAALSTCPAVTEAVQ